MDFSLSFVALELAFQLDETYNAYSSPGSMESTGNPSCELSCIVNSCTINAFGVPGSPLMRSKEFSDSVKELLNICGKARKIMISG